MSSGAMLRLMAAACCRIALASIFSAVAGDTAPQGVPLSY
jgi:hypothetical protein